MFPLFIAGQGTADNQMGLVGPDSLLDMLHLIVLEGLALELAQPFRNQFKMLLYFPDTFFEGQVAYHCNHHLVSVIGASDKAQNVLPVEFTHAFRGAKNESSQRMSCKYLVFKFVKNQFCRIVLVGIDFLHHHLFFRLQILFVECGVEHNVGKQFQSPVKVAVEH